MKSVNTIGSSSGSKRAAKLFKTILSVLVILAVSAGTAWYFLGRTAQAQSQSRTESTASTATVQRGDITLTASGSGTLVSNESVNMSFSTSGRVAELNVKLGDMVKKGDVLARLEKAEDLEANLAAAQANLLQAQQTLTTLQKGGGSALAKAYQALVTAQADYSEALKASQLASGVRCSPEIMNKYTVALQQATQKVNDLIKTDASAELRTIAGYDYDTALANYSYCSAYTATEKTSVESTLSVKKEALKEAEDTYNTLKAATGIDPDTLALDETKVETAQTLVDQAQEALNGITLTAPMDGKITSITAAVGAIVDTSTFLTISDVSHPTVTVSLDETDMDKLVVGNAAKITFTALSGQTFTGKVSLANPQMVSFGPFRAASGQVALDEQYAKTMETVPLGLSATIAITGKEARNVLLVPVEAVKQLADGDCVVRLVGSDGKVTQQTVTLGIQSSTYAEITSGLKEGDVVSYTSTKSSSSSGNNQGGFPMDGGMPGMP